MDRVITALHCSKLWWQHDMDKLSAWLAFYEKNRQITSAWIPMTEGSKAELWCCYIEQTAEKRRVLGDTRVLSDMRRPVTQVTLVTVTNRVRNSRSVEQWIIFISYCLLGWLSFGEFSNQCLQTHPVFFQLSGVKSVLKPKPFHNRNKTQNCVK